MVFTSWEFVFFLPIILIAWVLCPQKYRRYHLLAASYFFYGWWDWHFLWLLLFTTALDYTAGILIQKRHDAGDERGAHSWITFSVVANLAVLAFFKYAGFFADIVDPVTKLFGLDATGYAAKVILPLGISFYTFQSLSYTIDVYRKHIRAEHDFFLYALYVVYFPQLVAGPIERSTRLLPQLRSPRAVSIEDVREGLALMVLGFFKKVAMASIVSRQADHIFGMHAQAHGAGDTVPSLLLLLGLYLFTVQIYMDFSGYTDIARGVTRFFGIDLMKNFEQPYLVTNMTDFWKRWHISLSSWFRDYLYAPLKGKRRGELPIHFALVATMTIAGFWHGSTWAFIVWGFYHGAFLSLERLFNRFVKKRIPRIPDGWALKLVLWLYVINVIAFSLSFFRNRTLDLALSHIGGVFAWPEFPSAEWPALVAAVVGLAVTIFIQVEQRRTKRDDFFMAWPGALAALAMGIMITATIYWSDKAGEPFIYFQF